MEHARPQAIEHKSAVTHAWNATPAGLPLRYYPRSMAATQRVAGVGDIEAASAACTTERLPYIDGSRPHDELLDGADVDRLGALVASL
jgi:hypothetical protein